MLGKIQGIYAEAGMRAVLARAAARVGWSLRAPFASLHEIGLRRGTDKTNSFPAAPEWSFLRVYGDCFRHLRRQPVHVLEIGVLYGHSLRTWKTYFPKGRLFGLDINPSCRQHEDARTSITIGSQADEAVLAEVVRKAGHFDIIIDDGSHVNRHMLASFKYLFPHLRPGGFYVLEDLSCSYEALEDDDVRSQWPGMHHNAPTDNLNNVRGDLDAFFLRLLHDMDHGRGEVLSVQFWPYVCVIRKAP